MPFDTNEKHVVFHFNYLGKYIYVRDQIACSKWSDW